MLSTIKNLLSGGASSEAPSDASEPKLVNIKDRTRETAQHLVDIINSNAVENFTAQTPDVEVMGAIYKMMVKLQADDMMMGELEEDNYNMRYLNEEMRHKEIIDALSFSGKFTKPKKAKGEFTVKEKGKKDKKVKIDKVEKVKPSKSKKPRIATFTNPSSAGGSSIIPKIAAGAVAAAGLAYAGSAIAGAESGGDYNVTFGDRRDDSGKLKNVKGLPTPEEMFNKKLTDMTLAEVQEFGRRRSAISPNSGAVGAYQFMPTTLFGSKGRPGLVQQAGLSMDTKFNKDTQDLLNNLLQKQNRDALTARGVPLTAGNEYMAHYIGAAGAAAVYHNKDSNKTVAEVMAQADLTPPGRENNPELYQIKASEFEKILEQRIAKHKQIAPHSAGQTVGATIDTKSNENQQLRQDLESTPSQTIVNQNTTNMYQPQQQARKVEQTDDMSAYEKKSRFK